MAEEIFDVSVFTSTRFSAMLARGGEANATLNLTNLNVTDAQIAKIIERLKTARVAKLWLSFNALTDTGMNILVAAMVQLNTFDDLQELCLAGNRLGDASVRFLIQALFRGSRLRVLDLGNNKHITDESVILLAPYLRNSFLEKLVLTGISATDVGAQQLIEATSVSRLKDMRLSSPHLSDKSVLGFAAIVRRSCLTNVVVGGSKVVDSASQLHLQRHLQWKTSPDVKAITALCAVHTVPRLNATSTFKMFPAKLVPRLAAMLNNLENHDK